MRAFETSITLGLPGPSTSYIEHLAKAFHFRFGDEAYANRIAVVRSDDTGLTCEVGALEALGSPGDRKPASIFEFRRRAAENTRDFNVAMMVPTGVGAELGGHAGDATPAVRLLGQCCDTLITHPNVVNASDINEIPDNALYVEGSVLSRLLMGAIGLEPVRSNRVLVVVDGEGNEIFVNAAINAVNAAKSSFGLRCSQIVELKPSFQMAAVYTESGRATGKVENLERLLEVLDECRDEFDAVALSSVIDVPREYHSRYFKERGQMVNPWGGVEALLTHSLSSLLEKPTAHSPMMESQEISNFDPGVVEPRLAAEAISTTFLQCVLKGLHRSPRLVSDPEAARSDSVLTVEDVSCLVLPDGCVGLPTLAALEQGIPVVAVRENKNLMQNDLAALPWSSGQLITVENYWEAVGVVAALREGMDPYSVRRPLQGAVVTRPDYQAENPASAAPAKSKKLAGG